VSGSRSEQLAVLVTDRDLAGLIVNDPANLFYLTGFTGSNALALLGSDGTRRFLTDFRYEAQSAEQVGSSFAREIVDGELLDALGKSLPRARIGFDDAKLSVREHARLLDLAPEGCELVAAGGLVERLRIVKDADELARIRAAARLVDEVYAWVVERGLVGRTERELALEIEIEMRRRGATGPSFPSIVAGGPHGALPHAAPDDAPIATGTLVTIDIGAALNGYCSDCTRTFAAGAVPTGRASEVYELVLRAQLAGLDALRPGRTGVEVDAVAREVIEAAGYGERFGHGLGHGVGIEIHEAPRLSRRGGDTVLAPGHVVTVEPGVYLPGEFGVRIEDLAAVTPDGHEVLSGFTKELLVVD
jgi:Xaa-Pro aminopeptidase